jgi:2-dehydropantoate 2-reductase
MKPYVVFGAGAVGSALAAYLARTGHAVTIVGRPAHVDAIRAQGGALRAVARDGSFLAPVRAATSLPETLAPDAVLMLGVQAPDVRVAAEAIAPAARTREVITWQNGIRAEATAAAFCPRILGGVVRFTATMLVPGEVRLRHPGQLIVGRHPEGPDSVAASIVEDLRGAGFTASESPRIAEDKALKLLINLVSGPPVLLRRTGIEPVLARVQVAVLEEAVRVFAAAGIVARPASGLGQPVEALLAHFRAGGSAPDTSGGIYNSTWQNLHHRRPRIENDFYHGEIVRLGAQHGVPTPVNACALETLEDVRRRGLGPEPFDLDAFRARFAGVVDFDAPAEDPLPPPPGLEI